MLSRAETARNVVRITVGGQRGGGEAPGERSPEAARGGRRAAQPKQSGCLRRCRSKRHWKDLAVKLLVHGTKIVSKEWQAWRTLREAKNGCGDASAEWWQHGRGAWWALAPSLPLAVDGTVTRAWPLLFHPLPARPARRPYPPPHECSSQRSLSAPFPFNLSSAEFLESGWSCGHLWSTWTYSSQRSISPHFFTSSLPECFTLHDILQLPFWTPPFQRIHPATWFSPFSSQNKTCCLLRLLTMSIAYILKIRLIF